MSGIESSVGSTTKSKPMLTARSLVLNVHSDDAKVVNAEYYDYQEYNNYFSVRHWANEIGLQWASEEWDESGTLVRRYKEINGVCNCIIIENCSQKPSECADAMAIMLVLNNKWRSQFNLSHAGELCKFTLKQLGVIPFETKGVASSWNSLHDYLGTYGHSWMKGQTDVFDSLETIQSDYSEPFKQKKKIDAIMMGTTTRVKEVKKFLKSMPKRGYAAYRNSARKIDMTEVSRNDERFEFKCSITGMVLSFEGGCTITAEGNFGSIPELCELEDTLFPLAKSLDFVKMFGLYGHMFARCLLIRKKAHSVFYKAQMDKLGYYMSVMKFENGDDAHKIAEMPNRVCRAYTDTKDREFYVFCPIEMSLVCFHALLGDPRVMFLRNGANYLMQQEKENEVVPESPEQVQQQIKK